MENEDYYEKRDRKHWKDLKKSAIWWIIVILAFSVISAIVDILA